MKITDFLVLDSEGTRIPADPHGNNVAFCCAGCGFPVLAVARANQQGSDEDHPAACKGCGVRYFLDVRPSSGKLYIHSTGRKT